MTQQINLYQPAVFVRTSPFAARRLLLVGAIWLAVLLMGCGVAYWRLRGAEGELAELETRQHQASQRITELQLRYPALSPSAELADQVAQLQAAKTARVPLLSLLADQSPDDFPGFSEHLQGLAREDLAGVWLRDIVLAGGGQSLVLEGSALRAVLVPRYVQRLSRQPAFEGLEFARLVMNRSEEREGAVDFVLRTSPEEEQ